jgi:hypothetical protein
MALDINKEILFLRQHPEFGQYLGVALQNLQDAVNNGANHVGVDPTGTMPAPPPVQSLTVKTNGGLVHAVVSDNNPIQKNLHWFVEYDTDPAFNKPHVAHLGVSRSMQPINLPAKDDDGNDQTFYFRAYSQYPGSHPSAPIHFGGTTPTAVNPGGTGQMTLLSSTGSGTAQSSGEQGGSGFGKVLHRPGTSVKRTSGL